MGEPHRGNSMGVPWGNPMGSHMGESHGGALKGEFHAGGGAWGNPMGSHMGESHGEPHEPRQYDVAMSVSVQKTA